LADRPTTVAEAAPEDLDEIEQRLAAHFLSAHGAPGLEAALLAAREETQSIVDLCRDAAINTVFMLAPSRTSLPRR